MAVKQPNLCGELLRNWRELRRLSQLELALEANVSARHVSFIETGRARPSRAMVLRLANVLDVPLREQNTLLHAAGFAPAYRETSLADPQMAQVRQALELILKQQEPFAALVFDRQWDLVMANAAYARMIQHFSPELGAHIAPYAVLAPPRLNLMRMLFAANGWRPLIANWEAVAKAALTRWRREMQLAGETEGRHLLQEILSYPGVPARWREPDVESAQDLLIPVELRAGELMLKFFTTLTTLGSPQDITLQELHIEAFHPVDEATAQIVRALAG
ncbi:MAG: helix-turn-helix transcriptional regulator [Acidobacteria bacterium]|nr:helix-turn-helix transcriptional regulator [Acidobacteriota bacterium]MBI3424386.1 helix-turn-helix transcriptional regulator [Acidobacteriota bacterium]